MNVRFLELRNLRPVLTCVVGVVNMKTVREFNIAQKSIVSTVVYMYVVYVICLYYLIKKYI